MRSRIYESQSIILEAEVIAKPTETGRHSTLSEIACVVTGIKHPNFRYMLNKPITIEGHHSGLNENLKKQIGSEFMQHQKE